MTEGGAGRPLLVCADDYGLAPGIDVAVAALVRAGRLGAFSCLVNAPGWRDAAAVVPALRRQARAGLHLNLTEGRPLSAALAGLWPVLPTLARLLLMAHTGRLPGAAVRAELDAQWQAFVTATGQAPDYLDGHQHVHHLPGVREAVLARAVLHRLPVRNTARLRGPGAAFKRWVIERSGGRALGRALQQRGLPHHPVLLGAYDFIEPDYRRLMRAWLAQVPASGALLFCHPASGGGEVRPAASAAAPPDGAADAIAPARQREWAYLASDDFAHDLAEAGVVLVSDWPASPPLSRTSSGG